MDIAKTAVEEAAIQPVTTPDGTLASLCYDMGQAKEVLDAASVDFQAKRKRVNDYVEGIVIHGRNIRAGN